MLPAISCFWSITYYIVKALRRPVVKKSTSFNPAFPNHELSFTSHERLGMYKSLSENEEPEEEKEDGNAADSVLVNQIRSGGEAGGGSGEKRVQGGTVLALLPHGHHALWLLGKCKEEGQSETGIPPGISGRPQGRFQSASQELGSRSSLVIFQLCNFEHVI